MEENVPPFAEDYQEVSEHEKRRAAKAFSAIFDAAFLRFGSELVLPDDQGITGRAEERLEITSTVVPFVPLGIILSRYYLERTILAEGISLYKLSGSRQHDEIEYGALFPRHFVGRTDSSHDSHLIAMRRAEEVMGCSLADADDEKLDQAFDVVIDESEENDRLAEAMGLTNRPVGVAEIGWLARVVADGEPAAGGLF